MCEKKEMKLFLSLALTSWRFGEVELEYSILWYTYVSISITFCVTTNPKIVF